MIVAVEPAESAVMNGDKSGYHKIQGIGPGFIPSLINADIIAVRSEDAVEMARNLIREEGLVVGISSGTNVLAALQVAKKLGASKDIVTVLPDRAERYLSMDLLKSDLK